MPSTRGLAAAAAAVCGAGLLMLTAPVAHATASESPPESSVTIDAPSLDTGGSQPVESTDPGEGTDPEPTTDPVETEEPTDPVETPDPVDPTTPPIPGGIDAGSTPILAVPEQAAPVGQSDDTAWSETDSSSSSDAASTSGSTALAQTGSDDTLTGIGLAGLLAVAAGITTKLVRSARREA